MQIQNHKEELPFEHYCARFCATDPIELAQRSGAVWEKGTFILTLLGKTYQITHPVYSISPQDVPLQLQTFLLRFLLEGRAGEPTNQFLTFREMPWGELYIQPFSGRILSRAAFSLGTRLAALRKAAATLSGLPLPHSDAGFEFCLLGNYRLRLLLWEGDEEFSPSAQVLYTANFAEGFSAEDRVVAAELLLNALRNAM